MTQKSKVSRYDCRMCGACCVQLEELESFVGLEQEDIDRLSCYYKRRHIVRDEHYPGLACRAHIDGYACVAFRGRVGRSCSCFIYDKRPRVCRGFKPGSAYCKRAREEFGL